MGVIIDTSQWQGTIDWAAVKPHIDGNISRCGYGGDDPTQDDKQWKRNVSECKRLGIPMEAYLYSYAYSEAMAISEAQHAIRLLKGTGIKRIWYDLEEFQYGTYAKLVLDAFAKVIEKAGYQVGIYASESYINSYLSGVTKYPIWCAKYSSYKPNIKQPYIGWQFTSGYRVEGINGRVDASHWYGEFASKAKKEEKSPTIVIPKLTIGIKTMNHGIIPDTTTKNGYQNDAIVGIKFGATAGRVEYRAHLLNRGWLPKVTGNSWEDYHNGYAGNDICPIDAIQLYYYTDLSKTNGQYYRAEYSVKGASKGAYYGVIHDTNWESTDGKNTSGKFGDPIVEIKARLI